MSMQVITHNPLTELYTRGEAVVEGDNVLDPVTVEPPKYFRPALKSRPPIDRLDALYCQSSERRVVSDDPSE